MLLLQRVDLTPARTVGELFVDGVRFCWTLEDAVRPAGEKIAGKTAIPAGVYELVFTVSERAKRGGIWTPDPLHRLPLLLNVPGFEGVRLHAGNTAADTDGCPLLGYSRDHDAIGDSRRALATFIANARFPDTITVRDKE